MKKNQSAAQPRIEDEHTVILSGEELHAVQYILDWAWRSEISEYMTADAIQAAESAMKKLGV